MSAEQDTLPGNGEDVNIFYASLPAATFRRVPFQVPVPWRDLPENSPHQTQLTAPSRPSHSHPPPIPTTPKPPDSPPTADSSPSNPGKISNSSPPQTPQSAADTKHPSPPGRRAPPAHRYPPPYKSFSPRPASSKPAGTSYPPPFNLPVAFTCTRNSRPPRPAHTMKSYFSLSPQGSASPIPKL